MSRGPDEAKREVWGRRLTEFELAGLPVAEFCAREGVSVASFYQWRRKLATNAADQAMVSSGRREAEPSQTLGGMRFLPVEITGQSSLEVVLPGGVKVLIPCREYEAIRTVLAMLLSLSREDRSC